MSGGLRHAACLLGDIGWRAHPDYRGEQSMNIIAHGAFVAIDHPGRAYLALVGVFPSRRLERRGAFAAVARARHHANAGSRARARRGDAGRLYPHGRAKRRAAEDANAGQARQAGAASCPDAYRKLASDRLAGRLRQLARLIGREPVIES